MDALACARRALLVTSAAAAACGTPPSGALVGESLHFRLFVDAEVVPPVEFRGQGALIALETNWSDVNTLLAIPEGKIAYHWVTQDHVSAECDAPELSVGCELPGAVIVSRELPQQHELNHAYMELRSHARPMPFVAEGAAEAVGCGHGGAAALTSGARWQDVVARTPASPNYDALYAEGGLLARYLIRSQGADAYLAYYRQAPEVRDPALFVDNFNGFWGTSLDEVWSAMHSPGPGDGLEDIAICPCSMPPLVIDGSSAIINDPVRVPYWTIPDVTGKTLALEAPSGGRVDVLDCTGKRSDIVAAGGQIGLARLASGAPGYALAPIDHAASGDYIADTCQGAGLYQIPTGTTGNELDVRVARSTATSTDVYLHLQAPAATTMLSVLSGTITVCGSCAFDSPPCQTGSSGHSVPAQGTFFVRMPLAGFSFGKPPAADVAFNALFF